MAMLKNVTFIPSSDWGHVDRVSGAIGSRPRMVQKNQFTTSRRLRLKRFLGPLAQLLKLALEGDPVPADVATADNNMGAMAARGVLANPAKGNFGLVEHWWVWRKLGLALADEGREVICPDLRGFGWSDAPGYGYGPDRFAVDLVELLDALGLEQVDLVGHDWGAYAGFLACIQRPERFRRVVALGAMFVYELVIAHEHQHNETMLQTIQLAGVAEGTIVAWTDVVLILPARLMEMRVEISEGISRKPEKEILDASEFFRDEAVIDFYTAAHSCTWRVGANGFDFSCLGKEKALIANENFSRLKRVISSRAVNASVDESYQRVRNVLELAWTTQPDIQSSGWRRERPGKLSVGMRTTKSNETQFTLYSRLLYYVTLQGLG